MDLPNLGVVAASWYCYWAPSNTFESEMVSLLLLAYQVLPTDLSAVMQTDIIVTSSVAWSTPHPDVLNKGAPPSNR